MANFLLVFCVTLVAMTTAVNCARRKDSGRYIWGIKSYKSEYVCVSCCPGLKESCTWFFEKGLMLWKCVPEFGSLDDPDHGDVDVSRTTFEGAAIYTCDPDYRLVGDSMRTCLSSGQWSGSAPICKNSECGTLDDPDHGNVDVSNTTLGGTATYTCDDDYLLVGHSTRTCMSSGEWSGDAPICESTDCGSLDDPDHGNVDVSKTTFGGTATYTCDPEYRLVGNSMRICANSREWTGQTPICESTSCGLLDNPTHGTVDVFGYTYQSIATYTCEASYELIGECTRVCLESGKWSGDAPTCSLITCGDLDSPVHGAVYWSGITYTSIATYTCQDYYQLHGDGARICTTTGEWSGEAPTCYLPDCGPLPHPDHGTVEMSETTYNNYATYSCGDGYQLVGECTRMCLVSEQWSGDAPVCTRTIPCPEGFNHYFARRNSCYYIPLETEDVGGVNWTEAKSLCEERGSKLVEIEDHQEQSFIIYTLTELAVGFGTDYWTGGRENGTESVYEWVSSGYTVDHFFWSPTQPDDSNRHTNCLLLCDNGEFCGAPDIVFDWSDTNCENSNQFICETPALI